MSRKRNNLDNLTEVSENDENSMQAKKRKLNTESHNNKSNTNSEKIIKYNKCTACNQKLSELIIRDRMPQNAVDEVVALSNSKLSLSTNGEFLEDFRPTYKLTNFSVYDANDHLCRFDTGLIEKNIYLFCSGNILQIDDANSSNQTEFSGVVTDKIGPINEWYMSGFDGGPNQPIGISTPYAEYYLEDPTESYRKYMVPVIEKIYLSKVVIEFLMSNDDPTYEDLLDELQTAELPKSVNRFTEETLLKNAQFICNQVISLDISSEEDTTFPLLTTSCMRSLIKLTGVTVENEDGNQPKTPESPIKKKSSSIILTKLIDTIVNKFFVKNIRKNDTIFSTISNNCGYCAECINPCNVCEACKNNTRQSKNIKSAQESSRIKNCIKKKCLNKVLKALEDDSDVDEQTQRKSCNVMTNNHLIELLNKMKRTSKKIIWRSLPIAEKKNRIYYSAFSLNSQSKSIFVNDFVMIKSRLPRFEAFVKIASMWEDGDGKQQAHVHYFYNCRDTILGDIGDKTEIFASDYCADIFLNSINSPCNVVVRDIPTNWSEIGNTHASLLNKYSKNASNCYYYNQMRYVPETARFEFITENSSVNSHNCSRCHRKQQTEENNEPKPLDSIVADSRLSFGSILYRNVEYRIKDGVYISPGVLPFKYKFNPPIPERPVHGKLDEELFPEYYRKYATGDHVKGSNYDTPEPFAIGCLQGIFGELNDAKKLKVIVNKMYRPENTRRCTTTNFNLLYWSDEVYEVPFSAIMGRCQIVYVAERCIIEELHKFYFIQAYDAIQEEVCELPDEVKVNFGNGKIFNKDIETDRNINNYKSYNKYNNNENIMNKKGNTTVIKPLRTLDIFSGCGGLSHGFSTCGLADVRWAIEKDSAAAKAFIKNHSQVQMFEGDCNYVLSKIINKKPSLPQKGDVELLCGGPPCQGFSGLNRFNSNTYSHLKNVLLFTFLSYADYFRPRFVVMENVQNFAFHNKGLMLKFSLYCLLQIGYQCTFAILQAGKFGLPQARRRLVLLAAAPGAQLPVYPEPLHVFSKRTCQLDVIIDGKKYSPGFLWKDSAPYRTVSVRDAIGDLPIIRNGDTQTDITYNDNAISAFQQKMRKNKSHGDLIMDHICKKMSPLVEARIKNIPKSAGADWRDLPNIEVELSDGTSTKKLKYRYQNANGRYKGVCACSMPDNKCDPADRQEFTLIPWCLPHTSNRNYGWAGTYGRLDWNGFFGTTITNPEPLGKQGRVLHPEQDRVVSIRECARSQGFPDDYYFHGSIIERYRQIGNAVPPPLAEAIGNEIKKVL